MTYRKIKERKSRQEEAKAAEEAMEQGAESGKKLIKLKPEQAALAKENGKRQVKAAPRVVKVSGLSQEKIKTQASMQKQQMEKVFRRCRKQEQPRWQESQHRHRQKVEKQSFR